MKKAIILTLCAIALLAVLALRAQVLGTYTNFYNMDVVVPVQKLYLGTINGPGVNYTDQANCLAIGQQLGAMTNAAGQKLFPAQYFTNQNFNLTFSIQDQGSMVPFGITITASQQ